jgi:hypothetical protein
MVGTQHLDLLDEFGTGTHQHEKGSLRDHLIGTYELLTDWGNEEAVALGGLFHSIYGTQYFRISSADLAHRPRITETIGLRAEELAFLFCATDRTGFIYEVEKDQPTLWDCVANTLIAVPRSAVRDLLEIEAANIVEQRHDDRPMAAQHVTRLRHFLDRGGDHLSEKGRRAFESMVHRTIEVSGSADQPT